MWFLISPRRVWIRLMFASRSVRFASALWELLVVLGDAGEPLDAAMARGHRPHADDPVHVALLDEVVAIAGQACVGEDRVDLALGRPAAVDVEVR